ncbi:hypothetical protein KI387_021289, partial [Taxus chinensis]
CHPGLSHSDNAFGVISETRALGSSACFQKPELGDEAEVKPGNSFDKDEMIILNHSGPSMVEKHFNTLHSVEGKSMWGSWDAHIQCQGLDPLLDRLGAESKISSDVEVFHVSDKIADQMHSKTMSE